MHKMLSNEQRPIYQRCQPLSLLLLLLLKRLVKLEDTSLYHLKAWVAALPRSYHLLSQVAVQDLSFAFFKLLSKNYPPKVVTFLPGGR